MRNTKQQTNSSLCFASFFVMLFQRALTYPFPPVLNNDANVYYINPWKDSAKSITNSPSLGGSVGTAVNGAAIFGAADATNGDAWINEGATMDTCRGNPH